MSITVERIYRVTIDGKRLTLDGDECHSLAMALVTALGIAPGEHVEHIGEAAVHIPPELPSGPLPGDADSRPDPDAPSPPEPAVSEAPKPAAARGTRWHEGLGRVVTTEERDGWIAEEYDKGGADWKRRAARRCEISETAVYQRLGKIKAERAIAKPEIAVGAKADPPAIGEWPEADDRELLRLVGEGEAWGPIATVLGKSAVQVRLRYHDLTRGKGEKSV